MISTNPCAFPPAVCDEVRKCLHDGLGLAEATDIDELFGDGTTVPKDGQKSNEGQTPRAFLLGRDVPLHVLVAGEFDLFASGLIKDCELGTIGVLQLVPDCENLPGNDSETLREWIHRRTDEATYLRHLLVNATRTRSRNLDAVPFTVELVFVLQKDDPNFRAQAGVELGSLMRKTTFLHAIGVNVWRYPLDDASHQRRALAWLLTHTRAWLSETGGSTPPPDPLCGVQLDEFRLAGSRRLEFASDEALHVIHGHNGSGKSSLVEALELVVTGKLERIEEGKRKQETTQTYREILRNKHALDSAAVKVTLHFGRTPAPRIETHELGENGIDPPLQKDLKAEAFRIDQRLADRLAVGSAAERAQLFLEAFFPNDNVEIKKFRAEKANFDAAFQRLPPSLQQNLGGGKPEVQVRSEYAWIAQGEIPWPSVRKVVPLTDERLKALEPLLPPQFLGLLHDSGSFNWDQACTRASEVDRVLEELRAHIAEHREDLQQAAGLLKTLGLIDVQQQEASNRALPDLMNEWLELIAITDVLEKEIEILSTIEAAQKAGYYFHADRTPLLAKALVQAGSSRPDLVALRADRDAAMNRVTGHTTQEERANTTTSVPTPSQSGLAALDKVAQFGVFGEAFVRCEPALSHAVKSAFEQSAPVDVRAGDSILKVGSSGWGARLYTPLIGILDAVDAVSREFGDAAWSGLAELLKALRDAHSAADKMSEIHDTIATQFERLVGDGGPFSRAINEALALLTPARWAYEDLRVDANLLGAHQQFEFAMGDKVPARLRLNTAELNTFSLVFFLLCARRVVLNPLRLLVLDDPLQNMDEFTVTTVARGLAKLLRLWKILDGAKTSIPWRVMLLLHSEEDVERIRQETPCAVYSLPWLSPAERQVGAPLGETIEAEKSWLFNHLQGTDILRRGSARQQRIEPGADA